MRSLRSENYRRRPIHHITVTIEGVIKESCKSPFFRVFCTFFRELVHPYLYKPTAKCKYQHKKRRSSTPKTNKFLSTLRLFALFNVNFEEKDVKWINPLCDCAPPKCSFPSSTEHCKAFSFIFLAPLWVVRVHLSTTCRLMVK